jgi:hypothetical protein
MTLSVLPPSSSMLTCPLLVLLHSFYLGGSADATVQQAEVAWVREVIAIAEVAHAMAMLAAEASAREAVVARDGATFCINEAKDRVAVTEREVSKRESRVEAEHLIALASAHADAEGLARRIALLEGELAEESRARETSEREHRACSKELTLLQTRGSELCHAIVSAPQARDLSEGM